MTSGCRMVIQAMPTGRESIMTEIFGEAFWDERYRSQGELWSGEPNPHLVSQASELSGGAALDVGSGEGADAIWLAERGWQVTALDVSTVALRRGAARAAEAGADVARRIDWLHEDVLTWIPEPSSYDLVSAQFMHLPTGPREEVFARLAAAVAPGGTLLIVGHHPSDLQTTVPRPPETGAVLHCIRGGRITGLPRVGDRRRRGPRTLHHRPRRADRHHPRRGASSPPTRLSRPASPTALVDVQPNGASGCSLRDLDLVLCARVTLSLRGGLLTAAAGVAAAAADARLNASPKARLRFGGGVLRVTAAIAHIAHDLSVVICRSGASSRQPQKALCPWQPQVPPLPSA